MYESANPLNAYYLGICRINYRAADSVFLPELETVFRKHTVAQAGIWMKRISSWGAWKYLYRAVGFLLTPKGMPHLRFYVNATELVIIRIENTVLLWNYKIDFFIDPFCIWDAAISRILLWLIEFSSRRV